MAIRRYYLKQMGYDEGFGVRVAAPKPVIDLLLAEKYGWLPQEIDEIPKRSMEEMMLVLNARLETNEEVKMRQEIEKKVDKGKLKGPAIGSGVV